VKTRGGAREVSFSSKLEAQGEGGERNESRAYAVGRKN